MRLSLLTCAFVRRRVHQVVSRPSRHGDNRVENRVETRAPTSRRARRPAGLVLVFIRPLGVELVPDLVVVHRRGGNQDQGAARQLTSSRTDPGGDAGALIPPLHGHGHVARSAGCHSRVRNAPGDSLARVDLLLGTHRIFEPQHANLQRNTTTAPARRSSLSLALTKRHRLWESGHGARADCGRPGGAQL